MQNGLPQFCAAVAERGGDTAFARTKRSRRSPHVSFGRRCDARTGNLKSPQKPPVNRGRTRMHMDNKGHFAFVGFHPPGEALPAGFDSCFSVSIRGFRFLTAGFRIIAVTIRQRKLSPFNPPPPRWHFLFVSFVVSIPTLRVRTTPRVKCSTPPRNGRRTQRVDEVIFEARFSPTSRQSRNLRPVPFHFLSALFRVFCGQNSVCNRAEKLPRPPASKKIVTLQSAPSAKAFPFRVFRVFRGFNSHSL